MAAEKFLVIAKTYELFSIIEKKRAEKLNSTLGEDIVMEEEVEEIENKNSKKSNSGDIVAYIINKAPSFKNTIKNVLALMDEYDFKDTPSVDKAYDVYLKKNFSNFDLLYEIDLFTHSTNVAYEILKFSKHGNTAGINVLNALLHDFGKSPNVKKQIPNSAKLPHEKISAKFVEHYFAQEAFKGNREITSDVTKTIVLTINSQHSPVKVKSEFLRDLITADKHARDNEIVYIRDIRNIKPVEKSEL